VDKRLTTPNDLGAIGYELNLVAGKVQIQISDSLTKPYLIVGQVGPDLRDGAWHHVAVTFQRTNTSGGKFFVDGQLIHTFDPTSQQGDLTTSEPLLIGMHPDYPRLDLNFRGGIDEVSLYGKALTADDIRRIFNAGSGGKCGGANPSTPPFIVSQPVNQAVTLGGNATFSVVAGGSQPLKYQWRFNGTNISAATGSSFTVANAQLVNAGLYSVLITNVAGSVLSSNALLTVNPGPTRLRVGELSAASGATVTVPVLLTANGKENAMQFSLSFNPARLTYVGAILANGSGATLLLNESGVSTGRVGFVIGLPAEATFPPGTQQLAEVTFTTALLNEATTTPINFTNQPIVRQVSDVFGNPLDAIYTGGAVAIRAVAYEGDISPRPGGDKNVTVTDWVLIGRFAARLASPTNSLEFQKADCAPRANLGNGVISVTDWVQAGRYAALLDPLTPVGGPTGPSGVGGGGNAVATSSSQPLNTRQVRAIGLTLNQGQIGTIPIKLQAQGNENALGFSLTFDPHSLSYAGVTLSDAAEGASLNVNADHLASGQLGLTLALPTGSYFKAGLTEVLQVSFRASTSVSGPASISFSDSPVEREISDPSANALPSDYMPGTITISPLPLLTIQRIGPEVLLSWPSWATNFVLQESVNPGSSAGWQNVSSTATITNNQSRVMLPVSGSTKSYRLLKR
jgi:hypothetical protein